MVLFYSGGKPFLECVSKYIDEARLLPVYYDEGPTWSDLPMIEVIVNALIV